MSQKLPTCPEICLCCKNGVHIFHITTELSSIYAQRDTKIRNNKIFKTIKIVGFAKDEDWLKDLIVLAGKEIKKHT